MTLNSKWQLSLLLYRGYHSVIVTSNCWFTVKQHRIHSLCDLLTHVRSCLNLPDMRSTHFIHVQATGASNLSGNGTDLKCFKIHDLLAKLQYGVLALRDDRRTAGVVRSMSVTRRGSRISRTVWPRITKFDTYIHIDVVNNNAGCCHWLLPVGGYRSSKTVENAASDGFGWNFPRTVSARITKFYPPIVDNGPQK